MQVVLRPPATPFPLGCLGLVPARRGRRPDHAGYGPLAAGSSPTGWLPRIGLAADAGAAVLAASAVTRFGVFEAGMVSADDPKYTVVPQRERLR
ncbi:hypothetical protein ACI8AC_04445 [Geodermatophilus sp. SYSU D00758]